MPNITYIQPDGVEKTVDVPLGQSLMEGAVRNDVKGIEAECGGACSCATCHAYIGQDWWDTVGEPGDEEADMLEFAYEPEKTSRLTCQVLVREDMEGLVLKVPEKQG